MRNHLLVNANKTKEMVTTSTATRPVLVLGPIVYLMEVYPCNHDSNRLTWKMSRLCLLIKLQTTAKQTLSVCCSEHSVRSRKAGSVIGWSNKPNHLCCTHWTAAEKLSLTGWFSHMDRYRKSFIGHVTSIWKSCFLMLMVYSNPAPRNQTRSKKKGGQIYI